MELPDFLTTQVREGKVVLVLGAGASKGAHDPHGAAPHSSQRLARQTCRPLPRKQVPRFTAQSSE